MRKIVLFLCGLCVLLAGCHTSCEKKTEQRLNLNIPADPSTLDPRKGGDIVSSLFHFLLFDGLAKLDGEGNVSLSLAKKVDISDDKTVYTFHLHDADWSDGSPITAWDFEKSWKDILHPDFPAMNAHLLYPIKNAEGAKLGRASLSEVGIRSLNAKTLEVTLERPTPYFLELVAFCVFYPINTEIDHSHPEWDQMVGKSFIGSGPFYVKEWKRNNLIQLKKNPHYFRANDVMMEEISLSIVDSEMTSLQMFEKGQVDIIGQPLMPLPTDAIPQLLKRMKLNIVPVPATTFCSFNVNEYPFNNVNIRKAFAYAMNRGQIVQNITQLQEPPALGIIPPMLKKYETKTAFFADADAEQARLSFAKGLKELGITKKEFPEIKYLYGKSESHHKIAQALQQQWHEVLGIKLKLECVEKKYLIHLLKNRNYQAAQSFWMAQYKDPMNIFERFKSKENVKNYPNWENETFIELLNASNEASSDEERFALLQQAEALFLDEMPLAPIFHWNSAYIAKPHIKSIGSAAIGNGFFDRVYINKK
ncbi:MAG: peptide ABC transporter substrate-binding protein [Simkaniaceae bacterium]|nr:peptide ABC transporter substrate-binding protein [Candidatus Sacchlamyda saccharinae]